MNLIFCLTILIAVGHIKCDLPQIKVNITDNEDQFITATKVLFAKLDWLIVEIDGITKRLNKQDEIINQLPTKTDISEVKTDVVELNERIFQKLNQQDEIINQLPTKTDISDVKTDVVELNQQIFQKLNQQDENSKQLPTKAEIIELINTNITELNQQIFQKLQEQDEKNNQLPTKAEISELMKLANKQEAEINEVMKLNQQVFQKLNQQDGKINQLPSKDEISELMKLSNKQKAQISEVLEKVNTTIPEMSENESCNKTLNEILQNPLLKQYIDYQKYSFSYSKSTEETNKMLSNQPLKEMGNWLVILRRQDGSENFDRNWLDYQYGFGNPNGEFFIGLEKLHDIITNGGRHELLIILKDFKGVTKYAKYDDFVVGNTTEKYELKKLGDYDGDAGNSLQWHLNMKFSTKDQDNDLNQGNCAKRHKGGWWLSDIAGLYCYNSILTGPYYNEPRWNELGGIVWVYWHGNSYSLKFVEIMVRPKA